MNYHIRVRAGAVIIENDSILLIEFNNENGLHYNLPAGGVEPNKTVIDEENYGLDEIIPHILPKIIDNSKPLEHRCAIRDNKMIQYEYKELVNIQ